MNIQQELELNFIFSILEAILLALTIWSDSRLIDILRYVFGINFALHMIYDGFIYPFFLNPLRTLPGPKVSLFWGPRMTKIFLLMLAKEPCIPYFNYHNVADD